MDIVEVIEEDIEDMKDDVEDMMDDVEGMVVVDMVKTSALRETNSSKKSVQLRRPGLQPSLALKDCARTAAKIMVMQRVKSNK